MHDASRQRQKITTKRNESYINNTERHGLSETRNNRKTTRPKTSNTLIPCLDLLKTVSPRLHQRDSSSPDSSASEIVQPPRSTRRLFPLDLRKRLENVRRQQRLSSAWGRGKQAHAL